MITGDEIEIITRQIESQEVAYFLPYADFGEIRCATPAPKGLEK